MTGWNLPPGVSQMDEHINPHETWLDCVEIGHSTVYLGDCLDVLRSVDCVDAVITDPPYGIRFSEYESHIDDPEKYADLMRSLIGAAEPLVTDGWFVLFQGSKRIFEIQDWINRPYRLMACAKNFTQILPGKGPLWSTDYAAFWPVGRPRTTDGKGRDWHVAITSNMKNRPKGHPCPRPLDQMEYVVDCFSERGMTVIDPFMGSGTTGVACTKLGRKFIGIEIERKYFDIACERIQAAHNQTDMFNEVDDAIEQESFPIG